MKESTVARISAIMLIACALILLMILSGCASDHTIEVYEYKLRHYVYHDYYDLQEARSKFDNVKGFHRVVGGVHEIHNMKGDFCNSGHELLHADIYEGRKSVNRHFK